MTDKILWYFQYRANPDEFNKEFEYEIVKPHYSESFLIRRKRDKTPYFFPYQYELSLEEAISAIEKKVKDV